jgi:hypothetical protein
MTSPLLAFLRQRPGLFYCAPCAARGENVPSRNLERLWGELLVDREIEFAQAPCTKCLTVRTVARVKVAQPS